MARKLCVVLLLIAVLAGCGQSQNASPAPPADLEQSQQESAATAADSESIAEDAEDEALPPLDIEDIVSILESDVGKVYENYEVWVSDEKDSVILYIWQDGIASGCYKASKGIAPYTTQWDQIVNSMKNLSISIQDLFDRSGRDDISTSVVVRNDQNPEAVLLMTRNGRVVLDAAN